MSLVSDAFAYLSLVYSYGIQPILGGDCVLFARFLYVHSYMLELMDGQIYRA